MSPSEKMDVCVSNSNKKKSASSLVQYDDDIFGAFEVTKVISNTQNGIIYESKRRTNDSQLVIKQIAKKSVRNFYLIHGQRCPAEFVYHFTASAKEKAAKSIVTPHEWIEGKNRKTEIWKRASSVKLHLFQSGLNLNVFPI
jgi:hypothetical protein